jgi:protein-disulfide isomerase
MELETEAGVEIRPDPLLVAAHARARVPVSDDDPQWGNPLAPVTIVEYSDFQCPFCSRVQTTIDGIKNHYGPDKVRFVFKHRVLPFHKMAQPAARAASTVHALGGNAAFWLFESLVFEGQNSLNEGNFARWAEEAGVPKDQFLAAFRNETYAEKVEHDDGEAASLGVRGTPNFFVNGVKVTGAQPLEVFRVVIDAQLERAAELSEGGLAPDELYVRLTEENFQAPETPIAKRPPRARPADDERVFNVPVTKKDPVLGPNDALVTIVEFSDFQCPFCKRVQPTLEQVRAKYGADVRIVWKDHPLEFHNEARPAATLARHAFNSKGNDAFWNVHDLIFEKQSQLRRGNDVLEEIAVEAGFDWASAKKSIDGRKYERILDVSSELAEDIEARGTPHFFVNGRRVPGAQPYSVFEAVIDQELIRARGLEARGVARSKIYAKLMESADAADEAGTVPLPTKAVGQAPSDAPYRGDKNAKVVVQVFSDFQCSFCARVSPTLDEIEKQYGKRVKVVWRNLPLSFHAHAQLAAEAAWEAYMQKGNGGFWTYHDLLFSHQRDPGGLERESLAKYAADAGLDVARFEAALDSRTHRARVAADIDAARKAGIQGTPGTVVNDYFVSGAQPFDVFRSAIDKALSDTEKK